MNRKTYKLTWLIILIISLTACSQMNKPDMDVDERTLPLFDKLQVEYEMEAKNIQIVSVDPSDYYDILLFTFDYENKSYIGDSGFVQSHGDEKNYSSENIDYLNYHQVQDLNTPFIFMSSMSSNTPEKSDVNIDYNYYYGWINDDRITEMVIDFGESTMHIKPVLGKYYSVLQVNQKLIMSIKGLDDESSTVYELKLHN